jgi:hypothetical protein
MLTIADFTRFLQKPYRHDIKLRIYYTFLIKNMIKEIKDSFDSELIIILIFKKKIIFNFI